MWKETQCKLKMIDISSSQQYLVDLKFFYAHSLKNVVFLFWTSTALHQRFATSISYKFILNYSTSVSGFMRTRRRIRALVDLRSGRSRLIVTAIVIIHP